MSFRFLHRRQWDEERVREVAAHLAEEIDDNRARGMTPQEARRRAYIEFGNPALIREEILRTNSFVPIENLGRDLRYAMWQLLRSPGFAATAMLTLALGIAVNTAVFSVANGLFFSSMHIRDESRVAEIGSSRRVTPGSQACRCRSIGNCGMEPGMYSPRSLANARAWTV